MKRSSLLLAAASLFAASAQAADQPVIAPAPAWVVAAGPLPAPDEKSEAPVEWLRSDQQLKIEDGRETLYSDIAMRIGTPEGLSAGNWSFAWRPDTDELTVHQLVIRRGEETIDVLASQGFTVIRREQNLEMATLDGMLTANIQPEGLQVGDIIEFVISISSLDPTLKGHVEQVAATWNGIPVGQARLRMQWPDKVPVKLRASTDMPPVKPVRKDGVVSVEYALSDVQPIIPPDGAPARYAMGRFVELSDFSSWAELAALMAPLYQKASVLPSQGALKNELDKIAASSNDSVVRAEAALALVQGRVRYVALAMGTGGLVPADADITWTRRYGDCKAKTALLLGLLRELGIAAVPVAVNAISGDGMDERLPMVGVFNHVLVRATIGGKDYWLDGTRTGDTSLGRLQVPAFGWGLPLTAQGAALVRMEPGPRDVPDQAVSIVIDATAGITLPAPFRVESVAAGDSAIAMKNALANLTGANRDDALRRYWKNEYDFVDPQTVSASFDAATGEHRMTMEGLAHMEWKNGWYETDGTSLGYKADFSRPPGQDQTAPFAVPHPYYSRVSEKILLPPGFSGNAGADNAAVDETVAGVEYKRTATLDGNVFLIEKSERSLVSEFPASEAKAAQAELRRLNDETVYLRVPVSYRPTEQELASSLSKTPADSGEYFKRGGELLNIYRLDEAIADFTKAYELDPTNVWAIADRGLSHVLKGEYDAAAADADEAAKIDPKNPVLWRTRGLIAEGKGKWTEAIDAYDRAIEAAPGDSFTLGHRAIVHQAAGHADAALRDSADSLAREPAWPDLYMLRANIFKARGDREAGLKEAAALEQSGGATTFAYVAAAAIYNGFNDWDAALKAYDRAIAVKPEAFIFLNRGQRRPRQDVEGRTADFAEAMRLDPENSVTWVETANLQLESGDPKGALTTFDAALAKFPDDLNLLTARGLDHEMLGDVAAADADFTSARAKAVASQTLNNLCWRKATFPTVGPAALEAALKDCNAALEQAPGFAAYLDSRALVLLRLGRLDDALRDYDQVLGNGNSFAASNYGRALVLAAKGDTARAREDRAAALKLDSRIQEEFELYGLKWPL